MSIWIPIQQTNTACKRVYILLILVKYNKPDPASSIIGVFNNSTLQTLYNDLTKLSDSSLTMAYIVGATIEDLDIKDIALNEGRTTKTDILDVYSKLKCGSTNHMRGFYSKTVEQNATYIPQFISQDYFDSIVAGENIKCGK